MAKKHKYGLEAELGKGPKAGKAGHSKTGRAPKAKKPPTMKTL